jgi:hypothetical protein
MCVSIYECTIFLKSKRKISECETIVVDGEYDRKDCSKKNIHLNHGYNNLCEFPLHIVFPLLLIFCRH